MDTADVYVLTGFPGGARAKEPTCQYRSHQRHRFDPGLGRSSRRAAGQSTPVFFPENHMGREASDATVQNTGVLMMTEAT